MDSHPGFTAPVSPNHETARQRPLRGVGATAKTPRRYAFACSNCRRKKIRCDGERPQCHNCAKSQETCGYAQTSTDVQLRRAQTRIRTLEDRLRALSVSSVEEHSRLQSQLEASASPVSEDASGGTESHEELFWSQIGVGDDGAPSFHGSTSRFHVAFDPGETHNGQYGGVREAEGTRASHVDALRSNSELLRRVWEPLATARLEFEDGVSPEMASTLLQIYWTWQHPLHNCVYKPCFMRDMALGGPYYSELLLKSIFAIAARHANKDDPLFDEIGKGERFMERVRSLLLLEMSASKPKIPTIQSLLILGGRQCSIGNSSEGWLYTGMAIRMMKDVGIHLNTQKLAELEHLRPEDLECRKRLYLSAYIWDKSISLALGRPPSLIDLPHAVDDILDHFDDGDDWRPNFLGGIEKLAPTSKCYTTTTFQEFCRLGEIITLILSSIYGGLRTSELSKELHDLEERLHAWYDKLEPQLKMKDATRLDFCPPPHIFSVNLLYHALLIILYRPYLWTSNSELQQYARSTCIAQAVIINDFFLLYGRTFNYRIMTYLVSYCIYTAATINVYEIKFSENGLSNNAVSRLSVSLRVLESEARQTPGIKRSIEIIKQQLSTWNHQSQQAVEPVRRSSNPATQGFRNALIVAEQPFITQEQVSGDAAFGSQSAETEYFEWDSMDTGAGFQPDAFHWTVDDTWIAPEFDLLDFPPSG